MISKGALYITKYFTQDFDIERSTPVPNAWGNEEDSFATVSSEKGFIQPVSGAEAITNGREEGTELFTLFCGVTVDIRGGDRVVYDGKTFQVKQTQDPVGSGISNVQSHQEINLVYYVQS